MTSIREGLSTTEELLGLPDDKLALNGIARRITEAEAEMAHAELTVAAYEPEQRGAIAEAEGLIMEADDKIRFLLDAQLSIEADDESAIAEHARIERSHLLAELGNQQ